MQRGRVVPKDVIQAHKWWNIVGSRSERARDLRDSIAEE